jgi:hypothetical protein
VFSLLSLLILGVPSFTEAGVLKGPNEYAKAEHFFNWRFAQKVWFEMNTWEASEAEWAKYAPDFEPWLEMYKSNPRKALDALAKYPKEKRLNIQRGYDMQLAYDQWFDQVYSPWYNGYAYAASQGKAWTFDEQLEAYAKRPNCIPTHYLNECGPVPDWRSAKWRAKEQEMMATANEKARRRK